jgi:hypothetical protein
VGCLCWSRPTGGGGLGREETHRETGLRPVKSLACLRGPPNSPCDVTAVRVAVQRGSTRTGCYSLNGMVICCRRWSSRRHHRYDVPGAGTVTGGPSDQESGPTEPGVVPTADYSRGQGPWGSMGPCWLLAQQRLHLHHVGGTQGEQHTINSGRGSGDREGGGVVELCRAVFRLDGEEQHATDPAGIGTDRPVGSDVGQ